MIKIFGAVAAQAQTTVTPPKTGEANDHTSPNATAQPAGKVRNATGNVNPGVVPPLVGEANDHTSANAEPRPAGKAKPMKKKAKKAKAPVTGEANDHSSTAGTTEAAKAASMQIGVVPAQAVFTTHIQTGYLRAQKRHSLFGY